MINKNFNSISQFSVPQEWIDGALNVPQEKRKKPIIFLTFSRTFAAVISLVIVCSISLLLFFLTNENAVPPVREPDSTSTFTDVTEDNATESNNGANSDIIIKPTIKDFINLLDDETVLPSQKPTSSETTKPTEDGTEKPTIEPSEDTSDVPTEAPTEYPPKPPYIDPTDPTEEAPQPPWVVPTESTDAPTEMPTEPTAEPTAEEIDFYNKGIYGRVSTSKLTGSKRVYCRLYSPSGSLMGDSNLFASSHIAIKGATDPSFTAVSYYPYRHMNIYTSGVYTYVFYNEDGTELKRSSIYLQANY